MGEADYWKAGSWNARCARCGRKRKADELVQQWQGYWVCPEHWESRQPQDFVRAIQEKPTPPWVQNPADTFVQVCTPAGLSALPDVGVADCAVAEYVSPAYLQESQESNPTGAVMP